MRVRSKWPLIVAAVLCWALAPLVYLWPHWVAVWDDMNQGRTVNEVSLVKGVKFEVAAYGAGPAAGQAFTCVLKDLSSGTETTVHVSGGAVPERYVDGTFVSPVAGVHSYECDPRAVGTVIRREPGHSEVFWIVLGVMLMVWAFIPARGKVKRPAKP
ncbi:hypothetical protein [Sinosporangium siamense]|nr:hypothetical protein [Sinosporangium siamense]